MTRTPVLLGTCALILLSSVAWTVHGQSAAGEAGQPLPGITPADFERFRVGLDDFAEVETAEDGLGPAFNGASCAVCHSVPAIGGFGLVSEVRAGIRDAKGEFRPVVQIDGSDGDTLFQLFSTPNHVCQPVLPPESTSSRGAFPSRCSAPVWWKPSPTMPSRRRPIQTTAIATASAAAPHSCATW